MPYIGPNPAESFTSFATQEFSTSATTSYTLDHAVANENEIALFINNVRQQPGSGKAYTATGTALTLSAATASTATMYCVFLGRALQTVNPATNSISTAMISDNAVTAAKISASLGKLGQVVSTTKTDTFSSSSTSLTDITGLSAAITPSASSSKVLVLVSINVGITAGDRFFSLQLLRGSTAISIGDSSSSRTNSSLFGVQGDYTGKNTNIHTKSIVFLDSPSTTSSTTYKMQGLAQSDSSPSFVVNRSGGDADAVHGGRTASSITLLEVLA